MATVRQSADVRVSDSVRSMLRTPQPNARRRPGKVMQRRIHPLVLHESMRLVARLVDGGVSLLDPQEDGSVRILNRRR